jgi:tRNA threonylcarbamoyladenosine biosynthesis protein TsaB
MLVLAIDTTTRTGSVALVDDGRVVEERMGDPARSHAERLPGELLALLESHRMVLSDVDVFAVASGPGSFTGLRVGIATMQGLAFAAGKPLIGVSTLDALADLARESTPATVVATWVNAWRGEVYAALYENGREVAAPAVEHPAAVLEQYRRRPRVLFIGDGAASFEPLIRETLGPRVVIADPAAPLIAGIVSQLARETVLAGHQPSADAIRPLYVRRTDAELARDARTGQ